MPRSLEAMAQYYDNLKEIDPTMETVAILLRYSDQLIAGSEETGKIPQKDPAVIAFAASGRASQGGIARAGKLSPERRSEIARVAAEQRWRPKPPEQM